MCDCISNSNEDRTRNDALANKFTPNDNFRFWKEVSKINNTCSSLLASTINVVTGENNKTEVCHDHYYKLSN